MDKQTRRALMKEVSYGYFKLPLKTKGHGVLTIAAVRNGEVTHYGASICAPSDMFCRLHGKFGTGEFKETKVPGQRGFYVMKVPGAHGRLADHLRGGKGLLQGTCDIGSNNFESIQWAVKAIVSDLKSHAASSKLAWLNDVDFDGVEPMTKPRKRKED
jgi:hypothetical protein